MAGQKQKGRKIGRAKKSGQNARYINEARHAKSHVRRITKHQERYDKLGRDKTAVAALTAYKAKAGYMSTRPK